MSTFKPLDESQLEALKRQGHAEEGVSFAAARAAANIPRTDEDGRPLANTLEVGKSVSDGVLNQVAPGLARSRQPVAKDDDLEGQGPELPEQFTQPDVAEGFMMSDEDKVFVVEALALAFKKLRGKGVHPHSAVGVKISQAHTKLTGRGL